MRFKINLFIQPGIKKANNMCDATDYQLITYLLIGLFTGALIAWILAHD